VGRVRVGVRAAKEAWREKLFFFSEEKKQKTFMSVETVEDPGLGRRIYAVP
jgi:hypothetical protein